MSIMKCICNTYVMRYVTQYVVACMISAAFWYEHITL